MSKTIFIDMDDTLCDFSGAYNREIESNPKIAYPQSQYGFFSELQPIEGAIASVKQLIDSTEYKPYILTAPSVKNPLCYTEKRVWVEKHFGLEFTKRLIISLDKSLLRGEILIDDWNTGRGQDNFQGELIHYGSEKFPDWTSVMDYLK